MRSLFRFLTLSLISFCATLFAADQTGVVTFGGLPLPGATVTATQGDKKVTGITDADGKYHFTELSDGVWNFDVEMLCFETIKQDVTVGAGAMPSTWEMKMLPLDQIKTFAAPPPPPEAPRPVLTTQNNTPAPAANGKKNKKGAPTGPTNAQSGFQRAAVNANANAEPAQNSEAQSGANSQSPAELNQRASDGVVLNGSVNNGASSAYAQSAAFGNNRRGLGSLYNFGFGTILDNSALDARNYSYTGQNTPKPGYNQVTGIANFGGPIRIPHLIRNGPNLFVLYQWVRKTNSNVNTYQVPTAAERGGDFSALSPIYDPTTGAPFPGNVIPAGRISPQALALLQYYPLPNFTGSPQYNFQIPLVGETHQDSLQTRLNKNVGNKNQFYGTFAFQRTRTDAPNMFAFLDKTNSLGQNLEVNWGHRVSPRTFLHFQGTFSRMSTVLTPNFANKTNVSGDAGITGNLQDPVNYGPPYLQFNSIAQLTDGVSTATHNQTTGLTFDAMWNYGRHTFTYGADYKWLQFNTIGQSNPRGTFGFTGASTAPPETSGSASPTVGASGGDFAGFLLGIPDTSKIAFGNADKYFRTKTMDGWVQDDWRVGPALTMKIGVRWDYSSPITEVYGRLVNLDVAPGFTAIAPVVANSNRTGSLSGEKYSDSLMKPDYTEFQPRVALAWRPIPASSLVVRASFGTYYNTSVYQAIATQLAQQAPLSKSLSVQNTPQTPLTLANGFPAGVTQQTFGVDPNFRVGYAQNWSVSAQRDLPAALVMTVTYLGIKGTRGPQEFVPNTFPLGTTGICTTCLPTGFLYETSNGNSTRQSGEVQLRRRLRAGFTATVDYTFSKSIDDSALGGGTNLSYPIAQNWLDLSGERALSNFDQRHVLTFTGQYTTGQGLGGGTLLSGWRGRAFKEWTVTTTIKAATGTPLTPSLAQALNGTGYTGPIRPNYTGASLYDAPAGYGFNPQAFTAPLPGQWGNAGRNSISGPDQFTMNASLARTFRLKDKYSLDATISATNVLNHVTFTAYNVLVNSNQFGLLNPATVGNMRTVQTTVRLRF